jgi:magnesium-transporting ATPase (P-type)
MATTMTFAAIILAQVGAVFACRTERVSIFKTGFHTNKLILVGILVELILLSLITYLPFLHNLFNTAPLGLKEWVFLIWIPFAVLLIDEIRKFFLRNLRPRKNKGNYEKKEMYNS